MLSSLMTYPNLRKYLTTDRLEVPGGVLMQIG